MKRRATKAIFVTLVITFTAILGLTPVRTAARATTFPSCTNFAGPGSCALHTREQATGQGSARNYNIYTEDSSQSLWSVLRLNKVGAAYINQFSVLSNSGHWVYPNISQGAERGMRPPYSWAPVRLGYNGNNAGNISLHASTHLIYGGSWNAGYDIWFEPRYDYYGSNQSVGGSEMMIWNAAQRGGQWTYGGPGHYYGRVYIDGIWWNINAGIASLNGHSWRRIYFVATRPYWNLNISLNPFMAKAGHLGYIVSSEYLSGLDYGFELAQGGNGLAVNNVAITGVRLSPRASEPSKSYSYTGSSE